MTLSDVAIRRPVFTAMMSVTLVVLGFLGYSRLGTDLYPDVTFPFVTITTVYPGAAPADVEQSVTKPIEDAVSSISGINRVFSFSREDVSLVFVEFKLSVPLAEGVQNVRDKVGVAQGQLPLGAKAPVIAQFDIAAQPVLVFSAAAGTDPVGPARAARRPGPARASSSSRAWPRSASPAAASPRSRSSSSATG